MSESFLFFWSEKFIERFEMDKFYRIYRPINFCLFAFGICPFWWNSKANRFVCKTKYLILNRLMCIFYLLFIVKLNLDNRSEIFGHINTVARLLKCVQIVISSLALLFMILLLVHQRHRHANIFNNFRKFDELYSLFTKLSCRYQTINRWFWIETISLSSYLILIYAIQAYFIQTISAQSERIDQVFSELFVQIGQTVIMFHFKNCATNWFYRMNLVNGLLRKLFKRNFSTDQFEHIVILHSILLKAKVCLQRTFGGTLLFIIIYGLITITLKLYNVFNSNVNKNKRNLFMFVIGLFVEVAILSRDIYVIVHLNRFSIIVSIQRIYLIRYEWASLFHKIH